MGRAEAGHALREEIEQRLDRDRHSGDTGYGIWSVYYDTRQLRFYWEKIEGLKFRRKLRVRHYGDRFAVGADTPVFVEIKQRVNRVTQGMPTWAVTPTWACGSPSTTASAAGTGTSTSAPTPPTGSSCRPAR